MYSSKEYRSKCIRNTVSSLLVLARDVHTSVPCDRMSCCTAKRRVTPFPGELEGQKDFRLVLSALPLSFTNLACQCGFITSSKLSPLPSFGPAANGVLYLRWKMSQSCWCRWAMSVSSRDGCRVCIPWRWSKGALSRGAKEEAGHSSWARGFRWDFITWLSVQCVPRACHYAYLAVHNRTQSQIMMGLPTCTYLHSYSVLNGGHRYW